ncbi:uncharacterized protein BDV17DRAFT_284902 [Aspergillus undulatus]|uniref:uncharacterized protein n=1 Tax=Aspergillus undulatus TaxID=1810928 RepID=UPI003CCD21CC
MALCVRAKTVTTAPIPRLRVIKNGFGAEITGLHFANGVTDEGYRFIEEAVKKHGFAIIRKTNLVDETHLELARKFGELDDVTPYNKAGRIHRLKYDELFDVGNINPDGSIVDLSSPRGEANKGNSLFHTDSSFNPRRAGYSLLLAHELPPPGTGGSTAFADMRAAYRDLDPEFKAYLHEKNFIARHSILHSKKMAAPECFKDINPEDHFMGRHLLLQTHERSGLPTIYLAKHIHSLEGVSSEESEVILGRLFEHATQDKYVVEAEWKDVGDMIVWDNTCTMHRAVSGEFVTNDKVGEPKKAPCASCHDSGSECILIKSRRGGNFRHHRAESHGPRRCFYSPSGGGGESTSGTSDADDSDEQGSGDVLNMELRNPSDALHILALSGENQGEQLRPGSKGSTTPGLGQGRGDQAGWQPPATCFDDYELVQRGLLRPSLVYELLLRYARFYHPYCPIVPAYLLLASNRNTAKIQRSDYFLLTAILTIASRDDPRHSLMHRYCWDHAQRLLVDVLLAHPWTQTPRTVEGLLLLAEWLPHIQIQETTSEAPKNLFSEDRTAWSLVGLAVRQGYLQRLDKGAFRHTNGNISKEQAEQNRLVWAYIFMADRQISVRLGQSFWSRGPSHSSNFTAQDFPSLQPRPETDNEDYAFVLQATMELIQILHNAHAVLYSSKERTLGMIYDSHYSRYLDDFKTAAASWHATWSGLAVSHKIKSTLLIMYEYVVLYTNAFSFQAVLTRASASDPQTDKGNGPTALSSESPTSSKRPFSEAFSSGIMLSPDGRFIFDALGAASNLLSLINGLDPKSVLCFLPSRYYLYGVYAAVLLHKADCAGAFRPRNQRAEITALAREFISVLEKAPATVSHICHSYSRMLRQLWNRRERERRHSKSAARTQSEVRPLESGYQDAFPPPMPTSVQFSNRPQRPETIRSALQPGTDSVGTKDDNSLMQTGTDTHAPAGISLGYAANDSFSDAFGMPPPFDPLGIESTGDMSAFPSVEGYFFGSFMPGVADFGSPGFGTALGGQPGAPLGGLQDWELGGSGGGS